MRLFESTQHTCLKRNNVIANRDTISILRYGIVSTATNKARLTRITTDSQNCVGPIAQSAIGEHTRNHIFIATIYRCVLFMAYIRTKR